MCDLTCRRICINIEHVFRELQAFVINVIRDQSCFFEYMRASSQQKAIVLRFCYSPHESSESGVPS